MQLIDAASEAGLDVVAITDHDTVTGWDEAFTRAQLRGMGLVRGIEVSCTYQGISIHLLAYLPEPAGALMEELVRARASRETRAQRIVDSLSRDVPITYDEVLAVAGASATIGRPHIADALVQKGLVRDRSEAFATYLHSDGPYYASYYAIDAVRAVELVRDGGGVPVMAHPFAASRGRIVEDDVVRAMAAAGLAGLEAYHRDHTPEQTARTEKLARELGLLVTGSSDFHGSGKPNALGENLTSKPVLDALIAEATSSVTYLAPATIR